MSQSSVTRGACHDINPITQKHFAPKVNNIVRLVFGENSNFTFTLSSVLLYTYVVKHTFYFSGKGKFAVTQ